MGAVTGASESEGQLEFRAPAPDLVPALEAFFAHLVATGESKRFHPHPFTPEAARERAAYGGRDVT